MPAHNKGFAKYGRQNIALKTLVILIGFCTLAVVNKKVTAKPTAGILMPVLRKAPNVGCNTMRTPLIITFLLLTFTLDAQKVRLVGDDSPYLCLNDSLSENFILKLRQTKVDSTITILYDYDNGRLPNSRRIVIWTHNGISRIRIIEGCNKISIDTTYKFNSTELWQYIDTTHFDDVTVPIKSDLYQSHDKYYHITVTTPRKTFFTVVRNYERSNTEKNKRALSDTRVILTNLIDDLFQ